MAQDYATPHGLAPPPPNSQYASPVLSARSPDAQPAIIVDDLGDVFNYSSPSTPYMHGLGGVDQATNWLLSNVLVISFFGLLAITLVYRWIHIGKSHLRKVVAAARDDQRYFMYNHSAVWLWIKNHILYAPLGHVRHNRELQLSRAIGMGTLPGRFHTILLGLYLGSNLAYCLVMDWHADSSQILANLRGRSGQLAALNIIPTIVFALRNNPLLKITGVSYDAFNLLHRWAARIVVIESALHTIAWAVNNHRVGGAHQVALSLSTSTSFLWGMVGTAVFGLIFIIAASPIRHAFYETFLNLHRITVAVALVGVYIHLEAAGLPQVPYIQLSFALWGAEWFWRFARICYLNVSRRKGITKVTIEALPAEACRVTFDLRRPWKYTPGCHVHAYLPRYSLWSSHPFSIAWAENKDRLPADADSSLEKVASNNPSQILGINKRPSMVPRASIYHNKGSTPGFATVSEVPASGANSVRYPHASVPHAQDVTSISLIMRARTGLTRQLFNKADSMPGKTITTWGAIEGPYGGHETFASYGTVILFAGGVGITHCVGYCQHLLSLYAAGTCATQKILLCWTVPNTEALEWVRVWMDAVLRMEHRRDVLRIQLFVTKPRHRGEVVSNTGSVQMFPGRCNPTTVLEKEMQERIGAVGVTVCGPGAFADSVRSAVRGVVDQGCVDFVEEAFTY